MFDGKAFANEIIEIIKESFEQTTRPITDRLTALEKQVNGWPVPKEIDWAKIAEVVAQEVAKIPPAAPGKDVDPATVAQLVEDAVSKIPPAQPGKDADPALVAELVAAEVAKIPLPAPGKDADPATIEQMVASAVGKCPPPAPGKDADPEVIAQMVSEVVAALPAPAPGKDADPRAVVALVMEQSMPALLENIKETVAALPKPKDGESITVDDVRGALKEMVEETVGALPKAKDGVGVAGAVIDRNGELVLTLTDGATKTLGVVVGKDADRSEILKIIQDEVAKFPKPKDGIDGIGHDDIAEELAEDGRTIVRRYVCGDNVKEFRHTFAIVLDRGVWKEGKYERADGVTTDGSFWIAQRDTEAKPGLSQDWRLAVKRGGVGPSAYDVAKRAGFKGSEKEWLVSLKGGKGDKGDPGHGQKY